MAAEIWDKYTIREALLWAKAAGDLLDLDKS
jgi:hypothetical protein